MKNPLDLLLAEEPQVQSENKETKFVPKNNAKREFAAWIREQFPELNQNTQKYECYKRLIERKQEICDAARQAWGYIDVTHGCQSSYYLRSCRCLLDSSDGDLPTYLEAFVRKCEE